MATTILRTVSACAASPNLTLSSLVTPSTSSATCVAEVAAQRVQAVRRCPRRCRAAAPRISVVGVHAQLGQDRGDRQRVGDVRVAALAQLAAVPVARRPGRRARAAARPPWGRWPARSGTAARGTRVARRRARRRAAPAEPAAAAPARTAAPRGGTGARCGAGVAVAARRAALAAAGVGSGVGRVGCGCRHAAGLRRSRRRRARDAGPRVRFAPSRLAGDVAAGHWSAGGATSAVAGLVGASAAALLRSRLYHLAGTALLILCRRHERLPGRVKVAGLQARTACEPPDGQYSGAATWGRRAGPARQTASRAVAARAAVSAAGAPPAAEEAPARAGHDAGHGRRRAGGPGRARPRRCRRWPARRRRSARGRRASKASRCISIVGRAVLQRVVLARRSAPGSLPGLAHRDETEPAARTATGAARMKPRASIPATLSTSAARAARRARRSPRRTPAASASSGVMSLNRMPGLRVSRARRGCG